MSFPKDCPLRNGGLTVSTSFVNGITEIEFMLDEHGGCGTRIMRCEVCGEGFFVSEDMGWHVPQYQWPAACMREVRRPISEPGGARDVE
ncbi:MAG: hypothetical protein U0176_12645 [Bacteroidia bacterium]